MLCSPLFALPQVTPSVIKTATRLKMQQVNSVFLSHNVNKRSGIRMIQRRPQARSGPTAQSMCCMIRIKAPNYGDKDSGLNAHITVPWIAGQWKT